MQVPLVNKQGDIVDYALVDKEDYDNVTQYSWCKSTEGYANGSINKVQIRMHHFIFGKAPKGQVVDHINGNKIDNRRENLRFATKSLNGHNISKQAGTSSQYKGVYRNKQKNKWTCNLRIEGKQYCLGAFDEEIEAAKKYDTFVLLHFGKDARTNNLVKYEDIKDIDINTLIKKKNKIVNKDLPDNIYRVDNYYCVNILYKKIKYRKIVSSLELAIKTLEEFQKTINEIKKKEIEEHYNQEILRNENGDAIIPIRNKNKDIVDYLIVSDDKWHECMLYFWSKIRQYYRTTINGKMKKIHHFVMDIDGGDDILVDHIDSNPLNNKNDNLRLSNNTNNNHNRVKKPNCSSKYFGVSFNKSRNKFRASIRKNGQTYHIGNFTNEIDAAKAYNDKAIELYGDYANLNKFD